QEIFTMLPLTFPVWLAGLFHCFSPAGKAHRFVGWAWIVTAAIVMLLSPRIYYLYPAFPILFAAGGIAWERWLSRTRWAWAKIAYPLLLLVTGGVFAPIVLPVLSPEHYVRYAEALHIQQPRIETHKLGQLPQLFADQFGWEEMAQVVARIYNGLPP